MHRWPAVWTGVASSACWSGGGRLAGLLTLHDVWAVPRERWGHVPAAQAMTAAGTLTTVAPQDSV
jgi:hypothetical protein